MNRRELLKMLALTTLFGATTPFRQGGLRVRQQDASQPNILCLVFDTFSARHIPLFSGYPRFSTPNLERLASHSTVYHHHHAPANFTTPATASILTGTYPWSHRAFNTRGTIIPQFIQQNIFAALEQSSYYRSAYSHNGYAVLFLNQFQDYIDYLKPSEDLFLANEIILDSIFSKDVNTALLAEDIIFPRNERIPSSLFLSLADQWRRYLTLEQIEKSRGDLFPLGFPMVDENFHPFILEDATDWLISQLKAMPRPFFMYYHILPPHEPYRPRAEFMELFADDWEPVSKKPHFFSQLLPQSSLNHRRRLYDRYVAYVDEELGRIYEALVQNGMLENTYVILTSDHGQLFERGIHGHITQTLYEGLLHVPLLISHPGQQRREDVYALTSAVDLMPTILHFAGQAFPQWSEGELLPPFNPNPTADRSVFALEAKNSFKFRPLLAGTMALIKWPYKLIRYFGFRDFSEVYELYHLENDPEELIDLSQSEQRRLRQMRDEMLAKQEAVDRPFAAGN
ncbi:MAG: sulfatase-like hydrolase/transferase [Ardenticatenaceae bacterium]|nr:sulfatase-like hydrolase/transferase [Ardenticatenaceae bacterium]